MTGLGGEPNRAIRFPLRCRTVIEVTKKYLGLEGFIFHLKAEKAVTLAERRALIEPLAEAIATAKGMAAANEFLEISREFAGA